MIARIFRHGVLGACLVSTLLLMSGCASWPSLATARRALGLGGASTAGKTEEDLRHDLLAYAARFRATVIAAADQISQESRDPELRRRALLWKMRITPLVDQAAFAPEPELSFVGLFAIATSQQQYLTTGAGRELFGEHQQVAVDAAEELNGAIQTIGGRYLPPELLARLEEQVRKVAAEKPIRGIFVPETVQAVVRATEPGGAFDWMMNLPLAPFRAVEGVESGAAAIHAINFTAQRFNQILGDLPVRMRWQAELLTYEIEQRPTVESMRDSLAMLAESSARLSSAAEALPENVRTQAAALIAEIDANQGALQKTLAEARGVVDGARSAAKDLEPLAAALDRTSAQFGQAAVAWKAVIETALTSGPGAANASDRPFDILDYERTATVVREAAGDVGRLVQDVKGLDTLVERIEISGRGLIDVAAWRVLALLLGFFVLLFLYRRLETHLASRRARGPDRG